MQTTDRHTTDHRQRHTRVNGLAPREPGGNEGVPQQGLEGEGLQGLGPRDFFKGLGQGTKHGWGGGMEGGRTLVQKNSGAMRQNFEDMKKRLKNRISHSFVSKKN